MHGKYGVCGHQRIPDELKLMLPHHPGRQASVYKERERETMNEKLLI